MKIRLQVAIAHSGICSRRKAEEYIGQGDVQVNGKTVTEFGTVVDPDKDTIVVHGKKVPTTAKLVYFLLNKPKKVVSTVSDPDGKETVIQIFERWWKKNMNEQETPRVYPVGRLDEESEGLVLLTNDGAFSYELTHPKFEVEKTYHIFVLGTPTNTALGKLRDGIKLKEGRASVDDLHILKHEQGNTWISLDIHQGLNRQVRRMCAIVNIQIIRLIRVKLGPFEIDTLRPGEIRETSKLTIKK